MYYGEDGLCGHSKYLLEPTAKLQEEPAAVALVKDKLLTTTKKCSKLEELNGFLSLYPFRSG